MSDATKLLARAATLRANMKARAEYRRFKRGPFDFKQDERDSILIEVYEAVAEAMTPVLP